MSFAAPTGSRFAFFAVLPFALFGIAAVTFPVPVHLKTEAVAAVVAFDGLVVLCLLALWPYHRLWFAHRLLAGMAAVFLSGVLAWSIGTGVSELPSLDAFGKLLFGLFVVGILAFLAGFFAFHGRPPWLDAEWWPLDDLLAAREPARASWERFVERWPSARAALVQVRLHDPDYEVVSGTPALLGGDVHANVIEFREPEESAEVTPEEHEEEDGDPWAAIAIWGEVLEASPERVRVRLSPPEPGSFEVPPMCEVDRRQVCDWELEMPDGSIEGAYGLRARAASARHHGVRLPRSVRRRLRRCRPLPEPAS